MLLSKSYGIKKVGFLWKLLEINSIKHKNNNYLNENVNQLKACYASSSTTTTAPKITSTAQPIGQRRFRLPVETDAHKLVNYCCGANYYKEGEDIKLKDDSEYPDWVWKLRLNYPPPIHELDPNTKEFYERLAIVGQQREWRLQTVWRVIDFGFMFKSVLSDMLLKLTLNSFLV